MQKIMITLPEELLYEVDTVAKKERKNRSEFIREALINLLKEIKKKEFESLLIEGYQAMADENLRDAKAYLGVLKDIESE